MDIKFCEAFSHITEEEGAVVEMEQGQQSYALLHFHNPMNVIIDGKHFRTDENAYLLLRPYTSYKYFSSSGGFINDYIILKCDESVFLNMKSPLTELYIWKKE